MLGEKKKSNPLKQGIPSAEKKIQIRHQDGCFHCTCKFCVMVMSTPPRTTIILLHVGNTTRGTLLCYHPDRHFHHHPKLLLLKMMMTSMMVSN